MNNDYDDFTSDEEDEEVLEQYEDEEDEEEIEEDYSDIPDFEEEEEETSKQNTQPSKADGGKITYAETKLMVTFDKDKEGYSFNGGLKSFSLQDLKEVLDSVKETLNKV